MIASLGMSDKIGHLGYDLQGDQFKQPYSSRTGELIDEEVKNMIDSC